LLGLLILAVEAMWGINTQMWRISAKGNLKKSTIRYVGENVNHRLDVQSEKDLKPMLMDIPAAWGNLEQTAVIERAGSGDKNYFTPSLMVSSLSHCLQYISQLSVIFQM